jgi:hypothetical protein
MDRGAGVGAYRRYRVRGHADGEERAKQAGSREASAPTRTAT